MPRGKSRSACVLRSCFTLWIPKSAYCIVLSGYSVQYRRRLAAPRCSTRRARAVGDAGWYWAVGIEEVGYGCGWSHCSICAPPALRPLAAVQLVRFLLYRMYSENTRTLHSRIHLNSILKYSTESCCCYLMSEDSQWYMLKYPYRNNYRSIIFNHYYISSIPILELTPLAAATTTKHLFETFSLCSTNKTYSIVQTVQ